MTKVSKCSTKLFDKLEVSTKDSIEFFEEWVVRVGRYGATEGTDTFEVLLDESKHRLESQTVELVDVTSTGHTCI